ncbi:hypothetical protein D9M72_77730 [compost metagenome]
MGGRPPFAMICALTRQTVGKGTDLEREQRKRIQRASARHGLGDGVGYADSHATRRCEAGIHGRPPKERRSLARTRLAIDVLGRVDCGAEKALRRSAISCREINPARCSGLTCDEVGAMLSSRMAGLLLDRPRLLCHFRPDSLPVLGTQFTTRNRASRSAFDGDGSFRGNRRLPRRHLRQVGRRYGQGPGQARCRAPRAFRDVGFQVHAPSLVCTKQHGQVFTNLVAYKLAP